MECIVDNCNRDRVSKNGYCRAHYLKWSRHGTHLGNPRNHYDKCSIEGCDRQGQLKRGGYQFSNGFCQFHNYRYKRYGDPNYPLKEKITKCKVEGCNRSGWGKNKNKDDIFVHGYCTFHYYRFMANGDPNAVKLVKGFKRRDIPEYHSWVSMRFRCCNKDCWEYKYYGGRGITVCDRWMGEDGFDLFQLDMGKRPKGTTLDRIDVNGNYEPSNCRWANAYLQASNKRNSNKVVGVYYIEQWDNYRAVIGINKKRINLGTYKTFEEAVLARKEAEIKYNIYNG